MQSMPPNSASRGAAILDATIKANMARISRALLINFIPKTGDGHDFLYLSY
jgi:hypothetical protein